MCELLNVMDSKIVQVALNGLDNILKAGELHNTKPNPYAVLIEECYGELTAKKNWLEPIVICFSFPFCRP